MAEVTLDFIAEQLARVLNEQRGMRDTLVELRDEMSVQTNILLRLEHRDRTVDGDLLKLLAQVERLQARVKVLEDREEP
jgi:hypothetical protein